MEWPENLARELPRPRTDEPPDLRRRIIAELRDHLHTAWQRELVRTGDAERARHNVLIRFGDPARLARKLWWDAMREKIMMQRGMLVALVAMVLVSAGSLGLTWFVVAQAGQLNQALLEQNRAVNQGLLARLEALGRAPGESAATSTEWSPLKFHVTWDKADGAPAAGVTIAIQGHAYTAGAGSELERTTGPDGMADFGLVRPGQYLVNAATPTGEALADSTSFAMGMIEMSGNLITLSPGQTQPQELICPSPPQEAEISPVVDWPQELRERALWVVGEFVPQPHEVGGHKWSVSEAPSRFLVVDSAGHLTSPDMRRFGAGPPSALSFFPETDSTHADEEWRYFIKHKKTFVDAPGIYRLISNASAHYGYTQRDIPVQIWLPKATPIPQLQWPAGTYRLARFVVGRDAPGPDASPSLPEDLLHPQFLCAVELAESPEASDRLVYPDENRARNSQRRRRDTRANLAPFSATEGVRNEWRLTIPPRLVDILTEPQLTEGTAESDPDGGSAAVRELNLAPTRAAAAPAAPTAAPTAAPASPRAPSRNY